MYCVTRIIHFCYGHRLLNYEGKCKYLHGHNAKAEVELSSASLDNRGMVMDFNEVKQRLQSWIDNTLDHKLLLNEADPLVPVLAQSKEPFFILKSNPTAETIAKFIFDHAKAEGFPVTEIKLWETPNSFATYKEP